MDLRVIDIKEDKECRSQVKKLYLESFPREERAPFFLMRILSGREGVNLYGIYENATFVGLTYLLFDDSLVYVLFLAIHPDLRGKGYGSRVFELLKQMYRGRKILLAIEPVEEDCDNYEERVNRKAFYEKNGFREMKFIIREFKMQYQSMGYAEGTETICRKEYLSLMQKRLGSWLTNLLDKE